jgi:hypothetical protein
VEHGKTAYVCGEIFWRVVSRPFTGVSGAAGIKLGVYAGSRDRYDSQLFLDSMIVSPVHGAPAKGRRRPVNGPDICAFWCHASPA